MKKSNILFVIPAYNEEENIEKVIQEIKRDINYADILVINDCSTDKTEKVLKDKLKLLVYEIIELIYETNYMPLDKYRNERIQYQIKILSKISVMDLLLEESYRKGYITESIFHDKSTELINLTKKVKGWIVYEKNNGARNP